MCNDEGIAHILVKYVKEVENSNSFVTWIEKNPLLTDRKSTRLNSSHRP